MNTLASKRCPWSTKDPLYLAYHDEEWGIPKIKYQPEGTEGNNKWDEGEQFFDFGIDGISDKNEIGYNSDPAKDNYDPINNKYNQAIKFPFSGNVEKLYRDDCLYDIVCIIEYNTNPIISGKGSAIFFHLYDEPN